MLGELDTEAIERLLETEFTGRIGCHAQGRTYAVPITYAYESGSVYGHSMEGLKLRMMRENPRVCFEVDRVRGPADWESVIAWGDFEELKGARAIEAFNLLMRHGRLPSGSDVHPSYVLRGTGPLTNSEDGRTILLYRITLTEKPAASNATDPGRRALTRAAEGVAYVYAREDTKQVQREAIKLCANAAISPWRRSAREPCFDVSSSAC